MELSEILSISGKPGLYKLVSHVKNGIVVESLTDGKKVPAFSHDRISSLEEISIFTMDEDMPLKDVFKHIYDKLEGAPALEGKPSNQQLKDFMLECVPDYDEDRVYVSHIKKIVSWYNQLQKANLLDFTEKEAEENNAENETPSPDPENPESK